MPAIPGPSQEVTVGDTVDLDASGFASATYVWAMVVLPGNSHCLLLNDGTATPSFVADMEGNYVLVVQTDGGQRGSLGIHASPAP